jgi:hypothetical protein
MAAAAAQYEGRNANRGGVDVEFQDFGSVVCWQEDLFPHNLKFLLFHSRNVANLCTNTSCDREMQKKRCSIHALPQ